MVNGPPRYDKFTKFERPRLSRFNITLKTRLRLAKFGLHPPDYIPSQIEIASRKRFMRYYK